MTTRVQYKLAYRLIRYCGDFETFNTLCSSYGIEREIRVQATESYSWSQW